jgi:RNA polymerase sigma factor (TIGR02999 family)
MNVSQLFERAQQGDSQARGELISAAYHDLRALAAARMRNERPDHTLTATALVHEVSLQFLERSQIALENQGQFLALAAQAMRNLLVDHARSRGRIKRGGGQRKLSLDQALSVGAEKSSELIELHEALERFSEIDTRKGQVVELRYFGGLTVEETADALGISSATVKRDWEVAKAWLLRELRAEETRVD